MRDLVSIIIPAYNGEAYIAEAIDSALKQTYPHCEIIIVDDGSTDGTSEAVKPFLKNKNVRYVYQKNKGLAAARNTGIAHAQGIYIAFLDSDDIFLPTKIERQVAFLKTHPECDISYCDLWHFYEETPSELLSLKYTFYSREKVFPELLKKNFINPLSVVMRRLSVEPFGWFNESYRRSEDWELWVRLGFECLSFCFLDEKLAKYRMCKGSLSYGSESEVERKKTTLRIFQELKDRMTLEEREDYKMNHIVMRHYLKLLYAKWERILPPLRLFHTWLQRRRLG